MKKTDALEIAGYYVNRIDDSVLGKSANTTRSYEFAMQLYMEFLETAKSVHSTSFSSGDDFSQDNIKEWLVWLKDVRRCSPESCNARFSSLKSFLKYLGGRNMKLDAEDAHVTVCGKGNKLITLYLPPKLVANLKKYIKKFHESHPDMNSYLFFSRVKGTKSKISQEAMNKRLKIYAKAAHVRCVDVPLNLHCHQFRHAKSTHLLNDGMNIAQLSKLLGHAQLTTTMDYLDITTDMQAKAMISLEDENTRSLPQKWGKGKDKLSELFRKGNI